MTFMQRFRYWVPVVVAMAFIYWMSTDAFSAKNTYRFIDPLIRFFAPSLSRKEIYLVHALIRKLAHVTEYFILGLLLFRAFRAGSGERQWWKWAAASLAVLALYAAGDEIHQSFVSTRTPSLFDVGIDAVGGLLAQCVSVVWYRRRRPTAGSGPASLQR
jgi:VanZ family protein